jgi:hopene-associated glycosyltransferase HpnB
MQAGVAQSMADYILFTDADIQHPKDSLRRLASRAISGRLDLVSRMVKLHCETAAERFLIPAFVFFFMMLYPFSRANNWDSQVAAAAGGVMLVKRQALNNIGGLVRIKSALIDDCALARAIKDTGGGNESAGRIELTLIEDIKSIRVYRGIKDIWQMIARTAFTQLNYSPILLLGTVLGLLLLFIAPVVWFVSGPPFPAAAGILSLTVMTIIYIPMVNFYRLSVIWALTLPAAALVYLGATIDSARVYWQGKGGLWKGRTQA